MNIIAAPADFGRKAKNLQGRIQRRWRYAIVRVTMHSAKTNSKIIWIVGSG
jgi:hypothetical protein